MKNNLFKFTSYNDVLELRSENENVNEDDKNDQAKEDEP
jgi:hypothetical protein